MWFLFIVPVAAVGALSSLFSVTKGGSFIVAAAAMSQWQRRKGYRAKEGTFTEREGDRYYGVKIDGSSEHDLSKRLGLIATKYPSEMAPHIDKRFDFTKSEGRQLRAITRPLAKGILDSLQFFDALQEDPTNPELLQLWEENEKSLRLLLAPVLVFFEQFPAQRVKS